MITGHCRVSDNLAQGNDKGSLFITAKANTVIAEGTQQSSARKAILQCEACAE